MTGSYIIAINCVVLSLRTMHCESLIAIMSYHNYEGKRRYQDLSKTF